MDNLFSKYNEEEAKRIAGLVSAYIRGTISKKEHDELDEWISESDENMLLFEKLTDEKNIESATKWMGNIETEGVFKERTHGKEFKKPKAKRARIRLIPYAVAASIVITVGLLVIKPFSNNSNGKTGLTATTLNDIAPGGNKAVLTLADGSKMILDSALNGVLTEQGDIIITKTEGGLEYTNNKIENTESLFNTITTPKGGQYKLALSDGSKVWLNAMSSIYYPVSFNGNERIVTISGEAYFEIAKDISKPFRVKVNDMTVEVLGTHFNVNAYSDEPIIKTTLAEGSIRIMNSNSSVLLSPGQEAQLNKEGEIKTIQANLEETLAWKEGQFSFNQAPIESIMRQVARWYDAEIIYEAKPTDHFNAIDVPRDLPVSKFLYYLETTKRVHFKIENKTITVMK